MTALQTTLGTPWLNISIFALFVIITLVIVIRVSSGGRKGKDFYTGGGSFSGRQNGIAIAGDYLSAASFLGIAGAVAFYGYDGLLYSIGFLVAWLVALLLVAEPLRNTGKYTMADVLSFRMQNKPVRTAAAISTLAVSFFYLLAQMAGAGTLVALLLGISADLAQMEVEAELAEHPEEEDGGADDQEHRLDHLDPGGALHAADEHVRDHQQAHDRDDACPTSWERPRRRAAARPQEPATSCSTR
jgi:Sodium:solute symporter family